MYCYVTTRGRFTANLRKASTVHWLEINPFTAKCGQRQISTKYPNFISQDFDEQIASCESTGRELSFEWSYHRISSTDSKVRVTLQNSIKHSGSERVKDHMLRLSFKKGHALFKKRRKWYIFSKK